MKKQLLILSLVPLTLTVGGCTEPKDLTGKVDYLEEVVAGELLYDEPKNYVIDAMYEQLGTNLTNLRVHTEFHVRDYNPYNNVRDLIAIDFYDERSYIDDINVDFYSDYYVEEKIDEVKKTKINSVVVAEKSTKHYYDFTSKEHDMYISYAKNSQSDTPRLYRYKFDPDNYSSYETLEEKKEVFNNEVYTNCTFSYTQIDGLPYLGTYVWKEGNEYVLFYDDLSYSTSGLNEYRGRIQISVRLNEKYEVIDFSSIYEYALVERGATKNDDVVLSIVETYQSREEFTYGKRKASNREGEKLAEDLASKGWLINTDIVINSLDSGLTTSYSAYHYTNSIKEVRNDCYVTLKGGNEGSKYTINLAVKTYFVNSLYGNEIESTLIPDFNLSDSAAGCMTYNKTTGNLVLTYTPNSSPNMVINPDYTVVLDDDYSLSMKSGTIYFSL